MKVIVRYWNKNSPRLVKKEIGDWIDLHAYAIRDRQSCRANEWYVIPHDLSKGALYYKKGDTIRIGLGVAMRLPDGYEAHLKSRSGTFDKYGLIQTNAVGTIDNSYSGNNDEWMVEYYATRDGALLQNDRLCQFRIQEKQPDFFLSETDKLDRADRGGYGSTGR